jgi:hypothetical protein
MARSAEKLRHRSRAKMMRINVPIAPQDRPWMWASGHNGHRRIHCAPTHGYEPTREAAMAAFAKSWRRE